MVKIKWRPEKIHSDVGFDTSGLPKGNRVTKSEPRYVKKEFLRSETSRHQAMVDHLIARARAKVLNNDIHGRKPEVKVMLGKDMYVEVKWKGNEVVENMVKKSRSKIVKKQMPCASADIFGKSVRFIMDTGCGHDLISQRKVRELDLEAFLDNDGMTFMTANGLTDSNEITTMGHEGLGQCKLHVLNQTPAVLSIGSRCTKEGYTFIWPEGEEVKPVINSEGACAFLEVDGDIPYQSPHKVPDDTAVQEGKNNLIKHLESLIQKLKVDHGNSEDVNNPKAVVGEDSGEELFAPSGDEPEEPSREDKGPEGEEGESPPRHEPDDREDPEGLNRG